MPSETPVLSQRPVFPQMKDSEISQVADLLVAHFRGEAGLVAAACADALAELWHQITRSVAGIENGIPDGLALVH